jgi:[histone H3]-lysine4 N-trimethyltransferase SETD1
LQQTDHSAPPDPRLGIARYSSGAYHPKDSKSKTRLRLAPYLVKPYAFDPKISIGPGPATQVVVTGFDPFTPESQIRTLFSSYGEIAQLDNRTDPSTGSYVGVCLVRYRDSKSARGPRISAAAAAKRAEKEGTGQRVGVKQVRVDRDREGHRCTRLVEAAVRRNKRAMEKVMALEEPTAAVSSPKPTTTTPATPVEGPPPGAPKGPSGKAPPLGPRVAVPVKPQHALVEQEPILKSIKRKPYIFIAHCYVPVLGTTVPHMQKRMRMYAWTELRCDKTGYYIIFEDSRRGEDEAVRCYNECNMKELFNQYVMNMECQRYGNPNYERSPTPERVEAEKKQREEKERIEKEELDDLELEKKNRAADLDPVRGALELLRTELKDKILSDIKTRIAIPTLFDLMDPERHVAKRRKLGIPDPANNENKRPALYFGKDDDSSAAGTPRSGLHGFSSDPRRKPLGGYDANAARGRKSLQPRPHNAFADERRKRPPPRRADIRPLHHRLQDFFHEEESDDEQRTSARETEEQESRPLSRMSRSSTAEQDEEDLDGPKSKKRRTERSEAGWGHESDDEAMEAAGRELLGHLIHKEPEDMANRELEQVVMTLPRSAKLHKRARMEILLRKKYADNDELFGISTPENKAEDEADEPDEKVSTVDIKVDEATPPLDDVAQKPAKISLGEAKKRQTKKKTKKQLQEEQAALKAAAKALVEEAPAHEDEELKKALEESPELLEPVEESRPEVEWELSTHTPRRTVEDDPDMVLDIDGWQHLVKDAEDLKFLQTALKNVRPRELGDTQLWAWNQKEVKALHIPPTSTSEPHPHDSPSKSKAKQTAKQPTAAPEAPRTLRQPIRIEGYYVPNSTGSARTEGTHKILNSEKSKYLPHRIRVQKEREERQNRANKDPAEASKITSSAPAKAPGKVASRANRANMRRLVNDINTQKQAGGLSADSDAVRFNQLKKRKKLVKFDRSAIHNWGLYAEENIQAGDMIIEYVGEKIRAVLSQVREVRYVKQGIGSSYLFRIDDDMVIDATKKGGIARFINHSCSPNCTAKIINVEKTKRIVIYALRDIGKGW